MSTVETRPIPASETLDLRHRVLRPHDSIILPTPGDIKPGALHIGCFLNGQLIGVGSLVPEPRDHAPQPISWRLGGMAVLADARGIGAGGKILQTLVDYVSAQSLPAEIWCHGRVSAQGFYERFGFAQEGNLYERPGTGLHALMVKTIR